jgi:uncharacterized membrane protein
MDTTNKSTDPIPPPHLTHFYDRDAHPVEFGRVLALSDGVFAIALTLLVLDLALPAVTSSSLASVLTNMWPKFLAFAISVVVVAMFISVHHRQLSLIQRLDGTLLALNIPYLALVALIPFFQAVLSEYSTEPMAYALYAVVIGAINTLDGIVFWHAHRKKLLRVALPIRHLRIEEWRTVISVLLCLLSIPLAYAIGLWTVMFWIAIPLVDFYVSRLAQ